MKKIKKKINLLFCMGTRPEGIKLAPIIKFLEKNKEGIDFKICSTGQHREMLKQVEDFFEFRPDYNLDLMIENQSLSFLSAKILLKMDELFLDVNPDMILVQGDTTSAFLTALTAFYRKIKIGHVEAGLRTFDKHNPFPEEINRQLISRVADFHFVPTISAYNNLLSEKIDAESIIITGNTAVDAILWGIEKIKKNTEEIEKKEIFQKIKNDKKIILVTMHRRESFGQDLENICLALKHIAEKYHDIKIIYPVHFNPNVRGPVFEILKGLDRVILTNPLDYESFIWLMYKSYFIVTDSGGIQEEAPTLKKPVLVIRKKTERTESLSSGISRLVGIEEKNIVDNISLLLNNYKEYEKMIPTSNPYGDGKAAEKIISFIKNLKI